jgi:microcystin-dependent protein
VLSIAQNTALFSILGTTYGGDGQTSFKLPDLRGRVALHPGNGPGLSPRTLGEVDGTESVTLTSQQLPAHNHTLGAHNDAPTTKDPTNNVLAAAEIYASGVNATTSPSAIGSTGGSQPHDNMQPFLGINFIIALEGVYPSRS